jgi:hypothetical protein
VFKYNDLNIINNFRLGVRDGFVDLTGFDEDKISCIICTKRLKIDEKLVLLGCNL